MCIYNLIATHRDNWVNFTGAAKSIIQAYKCEAASSQKSMVSDPRQGRTLLVFLIHFYISSNSHLVP